MRKLKLLTAMAIGISASAIGAIQVEAALYTFSVDFETKTVANFNDYTQSYYSTTYDLGASVRWEFSGVYYFDTCTINLNAEWVTWWNLNAAAPNRDVTTLFLPDFICSVTPQNYSVIVDIPVSDEFVLAVINDDANYARIISRIIIREVAGNAGSTMYLSGHTTSMTLNYNFDTTYLFNYFLSDTQAIARSSTGDWTFNSDLINRLEYVYTTAGNDEYRIVNTNIGSIGTLRKKYAIDYNMEYFRGESIGARIRTTFDTGFPYSPDELYLDGLFAASLTYAWDYYYLNAANNSQAIVDAPEFNFTYEDCGWDVFDIPCFINNGLAYITNDAPIISDAITLLNAGIAMAAQTFGIIGAFTTDNVFGYLILAGFGFIAVRWFLKND